MYGAKGFGIVASVLILAAAVPGAAQEHAPDKDADKPGIDRDAYEWTKQAEQERFSYQAAADRDEQLGRWCDTGFGPADVCGRRNKPGAQPVAQPAPVIVTSAPAAAEPARAEPDKPAERERRTSDPVSREVTIWGDDVSALVAYPDGSEQTVRVKGQLADGSTVVGISVKDGVTIKRPGAAGEVVTLRKNRKAPTPPAPLPFRQIVGVPPQMQMAAPVAPQMMPQTMPPAVSPGGASLLNTPPLAADFSR